MTRGPDTDGLGQLLLEAFWWLDQRSSAQLERAGASISAAQALTLTRIPPEGLRPVELARAAGVSRQAIHQTLNDLQEAGLVRREPASSSGAVLVRLTESGARRAQDVGAAEADAEAALAQRIGNDRFDALRDALSAEWGEP